MSSRLVECANNYGINLMYYVTDECYCLSGTTAHLRQKQGHQCQKDISLWRPPENQFKTERKGIKMIEY